MGNRKQALQRKSRLEHHVQQLAEVRARQIVAARERRQALEEAHEQELAEARTRYEARRVRRVIDIDEDGIVQRPDHLGAPTTAAGPSWAGLAAGFAFVAVIGITGVIVYLLVRRKDGDNLGASIVPMPTTAPASPPQIYVINAGTGQTVAPAPVAQLAAEPVKAPTKPAPRFVDEVE